MAATAEVDHRLLGDKKTKKRKRDVKESESDVGPTADDYKVSEKKKKRNVGPAGVYGAKAENKNKKKKEMKMKKKKRRRNIDVDDDLDVGLTGVDVATTEKKKEKKKKKINIYGGDDYDDLGFDLGPNCGDDYDDLGFDLGPNGGDVYDGDDNVAEADGDVDVAEVDGDDDMAEDEGDDDMAEDEGDDDVAEDEGDDDDVAEDEDYDDVAEDDDVFEMWRRGVRTSDNGREMSKNKKKSAGEMVFEAINAVAKAASEAALSYYIASISNKERGKGALGEVEYNHPSKRVPPLQTTSQGRRGVNTNPDPSHQRGGAGGGDTSPGPSHQRGGEEGKEDEIENSEVGAMDLGHNDGPAPNNVRLNVQQPNWGDELSREANLIMKTALKKYNKKFSAQGVHEFAGGLHINAFIDKGIYCHINFNVRLVSDAKSGDCDPKLVFAELMRVDGPGFRVTVLDVLGYVREDPPPRLLGCRACDTLQHRNVLRHGNVEFNPGVDPGFW